MSATWPTTVYVKDIFDDVLANDLEAVKRRVEVEKYPLSRTNKHNQTVAHVAAKEKNMVMLKYFLGKNHRLLITKDKEENTVLDLAVDGGALDIVRYLVDDLKANISQPHRLRFGNLPIHSAAEGDQLEVFKYLVEEKKVDVNCLNDLRESPIFLATEKTSMNVLKYLVEKTNANVTALDSNLDNILYASAMNGDLHVAKYILDERKINLDINYQDRYGRTLVYVASRFKRMDFIKYCVEEKGASIHLANHRGWTPLFEASYLGNAEVIQYMLDHGADMNHTDIGNQTLDMICEGSVRDLLYKVNMTRRGRMRRSVPDSLNTANSFRAHQLYRVPAQSEMIRNHAQELSAGKVRPSALSNEVGISELANSVLTIANFLVTHTKDTLFGKRLSALLSPQEMMRARMDQEAVKAVEQLPSSF